ncbi:prenyltransferase/squalene oxidase repeat-containing protein [Prauserella oleivorans]|uniref:Prenyltransferase/squalene oxidase repeat-containing protein n=1 Tax=Prauserella oleivorans TaxID=1478153 RepID=A0ABW5W9V9_9PSEU
MNSLESWLEKAYDAVSALLSDMAGDPWGRYSPSIYETGRLVALASSLPGHEARVRFLLERQRSDGSWGGPAEYGLVPTLSATDALLTESRRPGAGTPVTDAAERGLRALAARPPGSGLPDTVAVEIIVPALVDEVNARLQRAGRAPLPMPPGTYPDLFDELRTAVTQGHTLPEKLWHSLETLGPVARRASFVRPVQGGIVGCSPAATAAWFGDEALRDAALPAVQYLRAVQDADGGVPVAAPLALFERAWVLSLLAETGIDFRVPRELVDSLHAAFGEDGAAGGLGLPPDVDDTATALHALALLGSPRSLQCLWPYFSGEHFVTFPGERTPSTTSNAHALQAIGASLVPDLPDRERYAAAAHAVTEWLCANQQADGCWFDKWHASPYYATVCAATALAAYGGATGAPAVRRAVGWLLATQRPDGSWGHYGPTIEETAYAVRTLVRTAAGEVTEHAHAAAARGADYLLAHADDADHPPLWHDKDLYTPLRIVRTEILAALHLAHTTPGVAQRLAVSSLEAR